MSFPFITAEQRLAEKRGSKGVILGPSGVGKTTLLKTADAARTLFIDLEAGDLAVLDWPGDSVRPRTWQECRDLACYIGGPNPALRDDQSYSQAHYDQVCAQFGDPAMLAKYSLIFVDSITVAGRLCLQWAKGQLQAFSEKTGKPDTRGAYGLRASYGAKLSDARIDLAALAQLDQVWADRVDQFDGVFDQQVTVWEALTRIARRGRAVPFLQGGIVRLVRDEARLLPVALFSPRNIVKNSLKIQYVMPGEETADAVTVEYFSSRTWKPDEVTVSLPGSSSANPAKLRLFGCTTEAHAVREGLYLAAANRYRRRIITLWTELEGLIPTYGDLIAIAHDMPSWGAGGEIVAWDADTHTATLSEPIHFTDGQPHIPHTPHVMALRRRDGGVSGPHAVTPGSDAQQVVFTDLPDIPIETGLSAERTHFAFGVAEHPAVHNADSSAAPI